MSEAGSIPMGVKEKLSGDMESQNPSLVLIWQSTRLAQAIKLIRLRGRVTPAG
jgi:hypothetical protein